MDKTLHTTIMEIKFKKLIPEAKAPLKVIDIDAGFDLFAASINETTDFIEYGTGIAVEIPEGYVGLVFPRSSVTKYDLMLKNSVGVIDASYRGEIRCRFAKVINEIYEEKKDVNLNFKFPKSYPDGKAIDLVMLNRHIKKYELGDRVAQIIFLQLPSITLIETNELSDTQRGSGGFGHTGK